MACNSKSKIASRALAGSVLIAIAMFGAGHAAARDANRTGSSQPTLAHTIPNPYAPPQPSSGSDRAGDAYATGFAIGLGTALINKQREDEARRLREQSTPRR